MYIVQKIVAEIFFILFWVQADQDKEYREITGRKKAERLFQKRNCVIACVYNFIMLMLMTSGASSEVAWAIALTFPYLIVAQECDRLTKQVYSLPAEIFLCGFFVYGIITHQYGYLAVTAFSAMFLLLRLTGGGDVGLIAPFGIVAYSYTKDTILMIELMCIVIAVAGIIEWVKALATRNLETPFRLKIAQPFGPALAFASFCGMGSLMCF